MKTISRSGKAKKPPRVYADQELGAYLSVCRCNDCGAIFCSSAKAKDSPGYWSCPFGHTKLMSDGVFEMVLTERLKLAVIPHDQKRFTVGEIIRHLRRSQKNRQGWV